MTLTIQNTLALLGALGVGTLIGNYFQIIWQRSSGVQAKKQEFKETRYKCIILLMYHLLHFERDREKVLYHRPELRTKNQLLDEVQGEWHNMMLYGSDAALRAMRQFLLDPSPVTFGNTIKAMRQDLWGGRMTLTPDEMMIDLSTIAVEQSNGPDTQPAKVVRNL